MYTFYFMVSAICSSRKNCFPFAFIIKAKGKKKSIIRLGISHNSCYQNIISLPRNCSVKSFYRHDDKIQRFNNIHKQNIVPWYTIKIMVVIEYLVQSLMVKRHKMEKGTCKRYHVKHSLVRLVFRNDCSLICYINIIASWMLVMLILTIAQKYFFTHSNL